MSRKVFEGDFTIPSQTALGAAAEAAKVLSLPLRRKMLLALRGADMSASQLAQRLEVDARRVSREMMILSEARYIEQIAVVPPRRGSTPMRIYRLTEDCGAILAALTSDKPMLALGETIERRGISARRQRKHGGARRKRVIPLDSSARPKITRVPLRAAASCSCSNSLPDEDGCCINCTKMAGGSNV